jgi:hypothetical protein
MLPAENLSPHIQKKLTKVALVLVELSQEAGLLLLIDYIL